MNEARLPRTGAHAPGEITNTATWRAFNWLTRHRQHQAARVAPALPALAEKRREIARRRYSRWVHNVDLNSDVPGETKAPRHIERMAREAA